MWRIIAQKELKDALRDRRALLALMLFPVLGPVMIYFMLNAVLDIAEDVEDVVLPVVGYEYASDLMDFIEQSGIEIEEMEITAEQSNGEEEESEPAAYSSAQLNEVTMAIENRSYDFVLIIPRDFERRLSESKSTNLELHFESSRTRSMPKVNRVQQTIGAWSQETTVLRLMARGISPQIINPVNVQRVDVASSQARAQRVLGMIPLFVIMAAFVCGMGVAVDATAGERERRSLEPLLVNPVQRSSIVFGKWMVAALFSAVGLLLVMTFNLFALSKVPLEQMGLTFSIGRLEITGIIVTTIPLAFFATSVQLFFGIFAKSFKDAQAYLSFSMMLPMVPYFYNIFNTQDRELWMSFVPMLGQHMLLTDVISGKTPAIFDFALAAVAIFVFSLLFIFGAAMLFKRERIIFT